MRRNRPSDVARQAPGNLESLCEHCLVCTLAGIGCLCAADLGHDAARDWRGVTGKFTHAQVRRGRWAMAAVAIIGNLPLLSLYIKGVGPAVIAATTISGTAVMGLVPIFLLAWLPGVGPRSFYYAFWPGLTIGVLKAVETFGGVTLLPSFLELGVGPYAQDLGLNVWGLGLCTAGFVLGTALQSRHRVNPRRTAATISAR